MLPGHNAAIVSTPEVNQDVVLIIWCAFVSIMSATNRLT